MLLASLPRAALSDIAVVPSSAREEPHYAVRRDASSARPRAPHDDDAVFVCFRSEIHERRALALRRLAARSGFGSDRNNRRGDGDDDDNDDDVLLRGPALYQMEYCCLALFSPGVTAPESCNLRHRISKRKMFERGEPDDLEPLDPAAGSGGSEGDFAVSPSCSQKGSATEGGQGLDYDPAPLAEFLANIEGIVRYQLLEAEEDGPGTNDRYDSDEEILYVTRYRS
jgi:hypothetical protein